MTGEIHASTHPPLPPTTEDDRFTWLRLLRSRRVGPATFWRMLAEHGSAAAALAALPGVARDAGIPDYAICPEGVIAAEMRAARAVGAVLLTGADPLYPDDLREIVDAPPALWCLGDIALLARPMVALVGARAVSSLGIRMARKLGAGLSEAGVVVVSGLARGVDAEAHSAAIAGGTIAVMAGGVDSIYPPENGGLAQRIAENGLRISEQPMGMTAQARHFVARNRIVSGLSRAVVVVEAAAKSGSLITARMALDQGRDVLAVPGHPFDGRSAGSNMLLRDGAILVRGPEDVIEHLGLAQAVARGPADISETPPLFDAPPARSRPAVRADVPAVPVATLAAQTPHTDPAAFAWHGAPRRDPAPAIPPAAPERRSLAQTAALHQAILDRVAMAPVAEDDLIRDLATPSQQVAPALVALELDGRIARRAGGLLTAG